MKLSKFFVSTAVTSAVVAAVGLAYAQNTTTSPTAASAPATQGQTQPMPADSTMPSKPSTTGGMSTGPSTATGTTPSTGTPDTTRAMPADSSSMSTERAARADRN
jgi:hypothetical protein